MELIDKQIEQPKPNRGIPMSEKAAVWAKMILTTLDSIWWYIRHGKRKRKA